MRRQRRATRRAARMSFHRPVSERRARRRWRWLRRRRCTARRRRVSGPARFQRMQQRHDHARAGGADRVAERAGAAIDVELSRGMPRSFVRRHRHHRERLVDLEQVDIADAPAGLVEQLADRRDRGGGEPCGSWLWVAWRLDLGQDRQAVALGAASAWSGSAPRRRRHWRRRLAARDGAVGAERGLQSGNLVGRRP